MDLMIYIIKLLVIVWVLKDMAAFIGEIISDLEIKNKPLNAIRLLVAYVLSCERCFSFWFSLVWSGDIFIAAMISLVVSTIERFLNIKNNTTEL